MINLCHQDDHEPWPDVGNGTDPCCIGSAVHGPGRCTCWKPVYTAVQAPLQPGQPQVRLTMCADCAYRPDSPEMQRDGAYKGEPELLQELVDTDQPFTCHQGMRRVDHWRHPSGATVAGHPGNYSPPTREGLGYKADGTPADICGGWAARRLRAAVEAGA